MTLEEIGKIYTNLSNDKMQRWEIIVSREKLDIYSLIGISQLISQKETERKKDAKIYTFLIFLLKSNGYDN